MKKYKFSFIIVVWCFIFATCNFDKYDPLGLGDYIDLDQCDLDIFVYAAQCTQDELDTSVQKLCILYLNDYLKNCK